MQPDRPYIIGVTGGIGSGKSVVCRVCALRGIPLYDCDLQARLLIDSSPRIKAELCAIAGADIISGDAIDRPLLASRLFASTHIRERVNALVHSCVRSHFSEFTAACPHPLLLIESAILASSGLCDMVDRIWLVTAPLDMRISRAAARSSLSPEQVAARIEAQQAEFLSLPMYKTDTILNDGLNPILPRIRECLINHLITHA